MQQFQSYYPMYQNNYSQPMQNPYMQRMENLQQFQQAINQPMSTPMSGASQFTPLGKIVESMDIVKATDIPMDGNMYYFPKADGSEIYSKRWLANGQTQILVFKPILDEEADNSLTEIKKSKFDTFTQFLEGIQNDVKALNEKVDKLYKPTRSKKEVSEDE